MKTSQITLVIIINAFLSTAAVADCLSDYGPGFGSLMARCTGVVSTEFSVDQVKQVDLCIKHRVESTESGPSDVYLLGGSIETGSGSVRIFTSGGKASFLTKWNTPWAELNDGVLTIKDQSGILSGGRLSSVYNTNARRLQVDFRDPNGGQYSFQASCQ